MWKTPGGRDFAGKFGGALDVGLGGRRDSHILGRRPVWPAAEFTGEAARRAPGATAAGE